MAANITDVDAVLAAYDSIIELQLNWLLLKYGENSDDLYLYASGTKGLPELKQAVDDLSAVHIAFYHEEETQVRSKPGFALINYIPPSLTGVRRARALVQSRRIGALFVKTEHSTLTIDHLSNLTPSAIHQAVLNPEGVHNIRTDPSELTSAEINSDPFESTMINPVRRSFTETYNPSVIPPNYSSPSKSQSLFSSILRRNRNAPGLKDLDPPPWENNEDTAPPPTPPKVPPKDKGPYNTGDIGSRDIAGLPTVGNRDSFSEFAFISHPVLSSDDEVLVEHPNPSVKQRTQPLLESSNGALFSIPLDRKWVQETVYIPDPEERARRRQLAQEQRALEEQQAINEENERQARLKHEKDELRRQEEQEEAWRRASLEQELQEVTAQRRAREQREKEEDERKRQEIEMRKEMDRKRRMQEHEKLEKWRQQLAREAEAEKRKEEEDNMKADAERKVKVQNMVKEVKRDMKSDGSVTAWATVQTSESLVWRRRYIELVGSKIFLYRSPKDMNQVLEEVELRGRIVGLREPTEGFEELKAIRYSFAIQFKDGRDPWAMYGDTEEEKIKMLGMLHYAAGL